MASTSTGMRKALGVIKDSTTVGLANLNSEYKDLDIAVVKATNHVECPPKEKHVRTIFSATSASRPRADVTYCVHALARRIAKTHNWTVALKSMVVIHRILREGDPTFRDELLNFARNRGHILNLSNFKDDSSPSAWDYSAWVRTYALFLEERLECFQVLKYDVESERTTGHSRMRELDTLELLEHMPALQQLLHRLMSCQPEGASKSNYVIQAALGLVLKESFKLYRAINDGIINLVDKFFEMHRHDAIKALDIYRRAGQQAERLSEFYEMCKGLDLARNFQFPALEQPPQSFLSTMEEYVREAPRLTPVFKEIGYEYEDQGPLRIRSGTSPDYREAAEYQDASARAEPLPKEGMDDVIPDASALEESNALALAIVPQSTSSTSGTGLAYDPNGGMNLSAGVTGWELALVTNPSSDGGAANNSKLAGGLDKLTLDSLYEDALHRRGPYGTAPNSYNPGTVGANPFETGPGMSSNQQMDPFMASGQFAPPPNVQMAAMQQQQAMLMLQQQQQIMGVHPAGTNPFGNPYAAAPNPQYPYLTAPQQVAPVMHPLPSQLTLPLPPGQYQHNPFGNPGLL